nr:uncharacterized protein LOC109160423 [Ipomoea batatas]
MVESGGRRRSLEFAGGSQAVEVAGRKPWRSQCRTSHFAEGAAQEIGQRFCETILALGGGKALLEVEIDLRVFWSSLPSPIHCLGKEVMAHRNAAFCSAMQALEEASAAEGVIHCMRLENSGSSDSTGLYFEAALKFLTGAALFESCNNDSAKHNEMTQSGQIYSSTAKLCE